MRKVVGRGADRLTLKHIVKLHNKGKITHKTGNASGMYPHVCHPIIHYSKQLKEHDQHHLWYVDTLRSSC